MKPPAWLLFACLLALLAPSASLADTILFDDHIDAQQKTELRCDVPDGCVITGLGFRAAYDNITTMYVRYHRLAPNGTLTDPTEIRLGSEPNHACEAKVLLPDGYVAVGFGAAGEPEWDVTLLRIWARPLRPDGSLGRVKTFSDGFKPDREPERDIVLTDPDRVLTGAGLRFASNDIGGIYARSKRILNLTDKDRTKLENFTTRAWAINSSALNNVDRLVRDIKKYGVNRLDVDFFLSQKKLRDERLASFEKLCAAVPQLQIYLIVDIFKREEVLRRIKDTPAITGIIIDTFLFFHGPAAIDFPMLRNLAEGKQTIQSDCSRAGKRLNLNFGLWDAGPDLPRSVSRLPKEVGIIIPAEFARIWRIKSGRIPQFDSRDIIVKFNLAPHSTHLAPLPDVRIDQLPGHLLDSALAGADGLLVPIDTAGLYLPDTINSLSLDAIHKLAADPLQSTDRLWNEFCAARYGPSAGRAVAALRRTPQINNLLFRTFDYPILWDNGTMHALPDIDGRIKDLADTASSPQDQAVLHELLEPTGRTIDLAMQEKETAFWLLAQSIRDANHTHSANPTPQTRELLDSMLKLKSAVDFWRDLTQAYLYTKMYAIDGAPSTRAKAESPLTRLRDPNNYQVAFNGYARFVQSAEQFLAKYEHEALLPLALHRVRELSERGHNEEAAAELRLILIMQKFAPHIDKQNTTIAEIASSLQPLGGVSPDIAVMRHGDGRWLIEKVADRWSYQIGKDRPCLYLDFLPGRLETPADYILSFEYFDKGDWKLHLNYDSDYPPDQKREYHPVEPLRLTNTKTWKKHSFLLTNCRFASGQNDLADLRFVTGNGANIRKIHLEPKAAFNKSRSHTAPPR